jgi:lipid-binding SYLF domain-containing protein
MSQLSVGFQAGGQSCSQMIFFENKSALEAFTSGIFEFGANVGAIAITARRRQAAARPAPARRRAA